MTLDSAVVGQWIPNPTSAAFIKLYQKLKLITKSKFNHLINTLILSFMHGLKLSLNKWD